jgi:hypothetical protein
MESNAIHASTLSPTEGQPFVWARDGILALSILGIPNLSLAAHLLTSKLLALPLIKHAVIWLALNLVALGVLFTIRRLILAPLARITQHLQQLRNAFAEETGLMQPCSTLNVPRLALDIGRFVSFALEHHRKHLEAEQALAQAREVIAQFALEQQAILTSTHREIAIQYRSVLAYAHYLEEQITANKLDPGLRYDLDDVCESSFNLKLIAGALNMMQAKAAPSLDNVPLAPLMQQTMLALAPALDRRAMKLSTAEVDLSVAARGDAHALAHVLWMMLLGMIRYAADESTLRIRCLHSRDGSEALLSIVVSELSANSLTEDERGEHLARRLQHLTPHMFAQTISIHANIQLANMLVGHAGGRIHVQPLTSTSCEVCMTLPSAQIEKTAA